MDKSLEGPDEVLQRAVSPDRTHVWLVSMAAWAASQWVLAGELWCRKPPSVLFKPPEDWSFEDRAWTPPAILKLRGRRYPGVMPDITLVLNSENLTGSIEVDGSVVRSRSGTVPAAPAGAQPFAALLAWLDAYPRR